MPALYSGEGALVRGGRIIYDRASIKMKTLSPHKNPVSREQIDDLPVVGAALQLPSVDAPI